MSDINRMFGAMDLHRNKIGRIFSDFDRSFDDVPGMTFRTVTPRTTLYEGNDAFEIRAEVPGIAKDNLTVNIQGNYLEINGSRGDDAPDGYKVHRAERGTDTFSRRFTLPDDVDANKVEAKLKDGILYLTLPKSEKAKPGQIEINAA